MTFALEFVSQENILVPDKNAHPTDPIRIEYNAAFKSAYIQEFERSFQSPAWAWAHFGSHNQPMSLIGFYCTKYANVMDWFWLCI